MLPKRILLAEDDEDDRSFFERYINSRQDVRLLAAAENGEELFALLSDKKSPDQLPDMIVLDQNMPKRNGLQTLMLLKDTGAYERIPVFIYSTYPDEHLKMRCADAGAASVFSKPYSLDGYEDLVNSMLNMLK